MSVRLGRGAPSASLRPPDAAAASSSGTRAFSGPTVSLVELRAGWVSTRKHTHRHTHVPSPAAAGPGAGGERRTHQGCGAPTYTTPLRAFH